MALLAALITVWLGLTAEFAAAANGAANGAAPDGGTGLATGAVPAAVDGTGIVARDHGAGTL